MPNEECSLDSLWSHELVINLYNPAILFETAGSLTDHPDWETEGKSIILQIYWPLQSYRSWLRLLLQINVLYL